MALRRIGAVVLAAVLATSLAACSDDDDDDSISLEDADDSSDDESSDDESSDDEDADDEDVDAGDIPDFGGAFGDCLEFVTAYSSLGLIFFSGSAGGGEDIDVDEVLDGIEEAADGAPDDVADALETVASTYQDVLDDLGGDLEGDDFLDPDNAEAFEALNSDDFNEANQVVSDYLDEICTAG